MNDALDLYRMVLEENFHIFFATRLNMFVLQPFDVYLLK